MAGAAAAYKEANCPIVRCISTCSRNFAFLVRAISCIVFLTRSQTTTLAFQQKAPQVTLVPRSSLSQPANSMPSTAFLIATRASVRSWTPWSRSVVRNTAKMSSANSNHNDGEVDTNMRNMCHNLANALINSPSSSKDNSDTAANTRTPPRLCLAIAGGGSPAVSALTSTPNASSVLLESIICYDRRSYADFIGSHPAPDSATISALTSGKFSFSGAASAQLLSNAALHRAMQLSPSLEQMKLCQGVGCASALVSQSRPDKSSRAHVVVEDAFGESIEVDMRMSKESGISDSRRSRMEEDEMVGGVVLASVLCQTDGSAERMGELTKAICTRDGDAIAPPDETIAQGGSSVEDAAESIITGQNDAVILVPTTSEAEKSNVSMKALRHPVLPPDPLIFPGSFNPPHIGHVALANAAVKTMMRKRANEKLQRDASPTEALVSSWGTLSNAESDEPALSNSNHKGTLTPLSSFNDASTHGSVWEAADAQDDDVQPTVLFEMSLTNPDKPPMESREAARRVNLFGGCLNTGAGPNVQSTATMPDDWGVLMTSAPLFVQKVGVFGQYVAPSGANIPFLDLDNGSAKAKRKLTFVIGTDTMVRIINPKYYGNSVDGMLAAVREMGEAGVHFVVGGRLEQGKDAGDKPKFITGEEELVALPADVRDMFNIIQEDDFRLDISSTELRKRAKETHAI